MSATGVVTVLVVTLVGVLESVVTPMAQRSSVPLEIPGAAIQPPALDRSGDLENLATITVPR